MKPENQRHSFLLVFILLLFTSPIVLGQYSGLNFYGHEVPLNERTGLDLTPEKAIVVDGDFELSFDLKIEPNRPTIFGYIFRLVLNDRNVDLISSPISNGPNSFHLVIGEEISNISFPIALQEITTSWVPVHLKVDKEAQMIYLQIGDSLSQDQFQIAGKKTELKLFFGAHRFERFNSTDLPNMNIREIKFFNDGQVKYYWPLNQSTGTRVVEKINSRDGIVQNPNWIINLHTTWKMVDEFKIPGRISYCFDQSKNELVLLKKDSLLHYNFLENRMRPEATSVKCTPNTNVHLIMDESTNELFLYSIDLNRKVLFSSLLDEGCEKSVSPSVITSKWHHNRIINPVNHMLFTFGGYGQLNYFNEVLRYNEKTRLWDTLQYKGDFHPRYLAGLGFNEKDKKVYIIGGYGSRSGHQEISPSYYYDLITYSFKENTFETLIEFSDMSKDYCFSSTLHIDTTSNTLLGLRYSKFETSSKVQAVSVSLDDYKMTEVGNTFDFDFLDVNSTLNLFYLEEGKKLISVNTYFDQNQTEIEIHEIAYPPLNIVSIDIDDSVRSRAVFFILLIIVGILISFVIVFLALKKRRQINVPEEDTFEEKEKTLPDFSILQERKPSSIIIFGGFQVIDKEGRDITNSFTPLLKELFLYIMLSSIRQDKGVSSSALNEVFWFDKSEQSARNNRAVNIAKLRTLLDTVGVCKISKDTGYWKFEFDQKNIYLDYYEYLQIIKRDLNSKEGISSLMRIIQNGPALSNIQLDWLDDFKAELSNEIIDSVIAYINTHEKKSDSDFLIHLTNCVFYFDMVNEEAMTIKCKLLVSLGKHSLAKKAYEKFVKEYKVLYDEEYSLSFSQMLDESSSNS